MACGTSTEEMWVVPLNMVAVPMAQKEEDKSLPMQACPASSAPRLPCLNQFVVPCFSIIMDSFTTDPESWNQNLRKYKP